jgi:hypothetical protein
VGTMYITWGYPVGNNVYHVGHVVGDNVYHVELSRVERCISHGGMSCGTIHISRGGISWGQCISRGDMSWGTMFMMWGYVVAGISIGLRYVYRG